MDSPWLNLLVIRSGDLEAARTFYERLGLCFARHQHGKAAAHYACEQPGFTLEIYPLTEEQLPTTSVRLGFTVVELAALFKRLQDSGENVLQPPTRSEWSYRAVVADPDGHRVELVQRETTPGSTHACASLT